MDKAEYRIKLEQINSLAEAGDFKGAAAVVDTIDWRHVKSVRTLCMVGEIYEANKRYEDSKRVLQYAYKRSSISKTVLYRLAEINIRTGDYDEAKRYYHEFEQLSPHDTSRYILKYKLLKAEGAALDDQIAVLKEYKEREYTERWAYELAKLYMKNGQKQKCIEECDEMILWFAEGKYVTRAMELKMKLRSLSDSQKKKYNERYEAEEKESAEEAILEESMTADERISKAADLAVDEEEAAAQEADKGRKISAAEMIHKMDIAADETVSSALSDDRTAPKPVTVPKEVEPVRVIEETAATEAAEEKAWEAMKSAQQTVENEAVATAEETEEAAEEIAAFAEETAESVGEAAATAEEAVEAADKSAGAAEEVKEAADEPAGAAEEAVEVANEPAGAAEEVKEVADEVAASEEQTAESVDEVVAEAADEPARAAEEAVEVANEPAKAAEETVEAADKPVGAAEEVVGAAAGASAAKAAALAREFAAQAGEDAAEEAAWKAQAERTSGIAERKISAVQETEGAALADAEEEAAWKAAVAREATQVAAETADGTDKIAEKAAKAATTTAAEVSETEKTAEEAAAEAAETEKAAEEAAAEAAETEKAAEEAAMTAVEASDTEKTAEQAAEAAEAETTAEEEVETVEIDWDIVDEDSEDDAETEEEIPEDIEEADAVEEDEPEEEPVPLTPEELAKNADEEAERALQEMMASFLNEFAVSGSEYKMTTDIIPDEDDVQGEVVPVKQSRDDREQMLGKETDESLGLTRTESFQEQLKKALEEGGNFEEASQIVISEEFESPEAAAKRTVMTAHGLEYDPTAELEDETDEEEAAEDEEKPDEEVSEESADDEELIGEEEDNDTGDSEETTSDEDEPGDESEDESGEPFAEDDDSDDDSDETEGGSEDEADETETAEEEPEEEPEPEPVAPAPKILERVEVIPRKFTEEEEILFSYFTDIPGISQQATLALADIHNNAGDKTSKSGNVLIMGRQLSGKTRLADALICAACMDLNIEAAKVAKVIGEDLNDKDAAEIVNHMAGGFLLIEGAGSLSDEFVENLNKAMEFRTDSLVVILEDEKADLMAMLGKHEDFAKKFTSTIIIPVFTNDELVTFARTYANEQGYKLDEMGTLALYTMIGENQKDNEPVVVGKVKKMVDQAIERSKGPKIASLFRKNATAEDGRIWLREKDFRF